jgi:hypothetical protein
VRKSSFQKIHAINAMLTSDWKRRGAHFFMPNDLEQNGAARSHEVAKGYPSGLSIEVRMFHGIFLGYLCAFFHQSFR